MSSFIFSYGQSARMHQGLYVKVLNKQAVKDDLRHVANIDGIPERHYFLVDADTFSYNDFFEHRQSASVLKRETIKGFPFVEQYLLGDYLYQVFKIKGPAVKQKSECPYTDSIYVFDSCSVLTPIKIGEPWTNVLFEELNEDEGAKNIILSSHSNRSRCSIVDGIEYVPINDSCVEVLKDRLNRKHVSIPYSISVNGRDFRVTSVADTAFFKGQLESINLPDGIVRIGDFSFAGSKLKSVNLPERLEHIGIFAFASTQIRDVKLPLSLTFLGRYSFANTQLTGVVFPPLIHRVEDGVFMNCSLLKSSNIHLANVSYIGRFSFCRTGINDLSFLSNQVRYLGDYCFKSCDNLKRISLQKQICEPDSTGYGVFAGCKNLKKCVVRSNKVNFNVLFAGCSKLTEIVLPDSVGSLNGTFAFCKSLKRIELPQKVDSLCGTFRHCRKLEYVKFPLRVKEIDYNFFQACQNLKVIEVNKSLLEDVDFSFLGIEDDIEFDIKVRSE